MSSVFGSVQYISARYYGWADQVADNVPWFNLRERMTQLYVEQDKSLKEVMSTLERTHGFTATYVDYAD